jgi:lipid-A-disaccharide synthase-like uncharacterized protein
MKDMQDDASKEGTTSTPPSSVCPRWSRPSFHLARQMDGWRNNASNKVRYVLKNAPVVSPKRADQAFADLRSQLHIAHRQNLEAFNRWKGSKQLLVGIWFKNRCIYIAFKICYMNNESVAFWHYYLCGHLVFLFYFFSKMYSIHLKLLIILTFRGAFHSKRNISIKVKTISI